MLRRFLHDEHGSAAEFALILPLALLIMFSIIDGGRYLWEVNRAEKATQAGARIAAVTAMVPQGLANYAFAIDADAPQGQPVDNADFPGVECESDGTAADCSWVGTPSDAFDLEPDTGAFNQVVDRMQHFMPELEPENVLIDYANGSLGFAGDPSGSDVAPLITVRLRDVEFQSILTSVFGLTWGLPSAPYTISQEDGSGVCFEEYDDTDCDLG